MESEVKIPAIIAPNFQMLHCSGCKETKPEDQFYSNKSTKTGKGSYCRACLSARRKKARAEFQLSARPLLEEQQNEVKKIVQVLMENPRMKVVDIAKETGLTPAEVTFHMNRNEYMKAVQMIATRKVKNLIPKALKGLDESLVSKDGDIKLKSSMEVLKSEGVLGPTKIEVTSGVSELTVQQLQDIILRAKLENSDQTIPAELVK